MDQQLVEQIYECAFMPESWPCVLGSLAQTGAARGAALFVSNSVKPLVWTVSPGVQDIMESFVKSGYFMRQKRVLINLEFRSRTHYNGFLTESHINLTEADLATDPLYVEFLWPLGLGWSAVSSFPLPTGDRLFFTLERDRDRGPMDSDEIQRLNELRPHLARSALISARLHLERARIAAETLALIGLPALVFDAGGKVLAANGLIEAQKSLFHWRAHDQVSLTDAAADTLFKHAIETLHVTQAAPTRSFAIRGAETTAAMVAHVIPIRRTARDIFGRSAGVLVLTPVTLPQAPPVELVESLFDLTPAEARVARSLTAGATVEEIAVTVGVSPNTVRTQVRAVLEKTGCRRQAEVVALLGGIAAPQRLSP
jgi:DNA-binding CsgD family transcriptional regulator